MQATVGCGARAVDWDAGTLLGLHHTSVRMYQSVDLGFHGNNAVHGHITATVEANVSAVGPGRAKCSFPAIAKRRSRRLAACLGHGAMECTTRRELTGRVSGRRHSHCLAAERSATVVVAAAARVGYDMVLARSCT
jgi:hypothetical protein